MIATDARPSRYFNGLKRRIQHGPSLAPAKETGLKPTPKRETTPVQ